MLKKKSRHRFHDRSKDEYRSRWKDMSWYEDKVDNMLSGLVIFRNE